MSGPPYKDMPMNAQKLEYMEKKYGRSPHRDFNLKMNRILENLRTYPIKSLKYTVEAQNLLSIMATHEPSLNREESRELLRKAKRKYHALFRYIILNRTDKAEKIFGDIVSLVKENGIPVTEMV